MNLLVDREALVTHALDGVGIPAPEFFSPGFGLVPNDVPRYALDPAKAAALLQDAGYARDGGRWKKRGKALTLDLIGYSTRTEMALITEAIAGMLEAAGIGTRVKMYTWPGMLGLAKKGQYDAYTVFWTPEMTGHPDMHLKAHIHSAQSMMYNDYANAKLGRPADRGPRPGCWRRARTPPMARPWPSSTAMPRSCPWCTRSMWPPRTPG